MNYDIYLVGVGGQGVLTIGDLITEAAMRRGLPVNFYPTKGMAQRGGFVKAQVRLGRETVGPHIPEKGADLVIAMELSEALKAVRFVKPGKDFVLFAHVWQPSAVMLGQASYPSLDEVREQIQKAGSTSSPQAGSTSSPQAGARLHILDPKELPQYEGRPVPANVYILGATLGRTPLGQLLDIGAVAQLIQHRWKRGATRNALAFQMGLGTS